MSAEKRQSTDYATGLQKESLNSSNLNNSSFTHYSQNKTDLLPTCNNISAFLNEFGYPTVQLISSDVNAESKYVHVFVVSSSQKLFIITQLYICLRSRILGQYNTHSNRRIRREIKQSKECSERCCCIKKIG